MQWLKRRLGERSTWAALGMLAGVFGIKELASFTAPEVIDAAALIGGLVVAAFPTSGNNGD